MLENTIIKNIIALLISSINIGIIYYIITRIKFDYIEVDNIKMEKENIKKRLYLTRIYSNLKSDLKELEDVFIKYNIKYVNITTIFILSIILSFAVFSIIIKFLNVFSTAVILAIFVFFIPSYIIKYLVYLKKQKIVNLFPSYIINLKNYTTTSNDIIYAFYNTKVEGVLEKYIERFNLSVKKGISVYDSFERLKKDINIPSISRFLSSLQFCYLNGGDFSKLLERYINIFIKKNTYREKEKQESYSSKLVLVILVIINVYMMFSFVFANEEYFKIITQTTMGVIIINVNVLSYIATIYMAIKLNKMEE